MRKGNFIGMLGLTRNTVRPFTDRQIDLVTNFAAHDCCHEFDDLARVHEHEKAAEGRLASHSACYGRARKSLGQT